ncbi:MAG: FAD-dependent oxidoreductase [Candidatus Rokubacteria bacterium]|nr:FAD-dependent oxidoreductase [Candidatus Rokubacteria bacterium]
MALVFPRLFSSIRVGPLTLSNRLCHAATLTNFAEHNLPSQRQVEYYEARARGGVGLIVSEAIVVHPQSVPTSVVIAGYDRRSLDGLRRIADAVHRQGVPMVAQLWHAGRQQLWTPISAPWAPSPIPDPLSGTIPHEMSRQEIDEVVESFAATAQKMQEAGFDGVELHGAHGYLITQFLSPWSNRRRDEYGGSSENRVRFLERVIERVRSTCGWDFVVGVKLNGHEFVEGGIDLAEAQRIATRLAATRAIDYIAVSQGNFSKSLEAHVPDMHFPRAPFRHLARGVKEAVGDLPVCAMARIVSPREAEVVLQSGDADLVGMSRALISDPDLPRKAKTGEGEIRPCIMCNVCWGAVSLGKPMLCVYNPSVGREGEIDPDAPPPASLTKRVVVVGGGLSGLEVSRVAALRGHRVVLFEKTGALGGQANLAARLPGRAEFGEMTRYLVSEVQKLPIELRLGVEATADAVLELSPDAVVLATGSLPPAPLLPGARGGQVVTTWDVIEGRGEVGRRVALIDAEGEHESCGVAELLVAQGKRVWFVTRFDMVGPHLNYVSRIGVTGRLLRNGVVCVTGAEVKRVSGRTLILANLYSGQEHRLREIETVVLAGPKGAATGLLEGLRDKVPEVHAIGDCYAPRDATAAVHEGHRVGRLL